MSQTPPATPSPQARIRVTHPRGLQHGPHAAFMVERRAIRIVLLPSAVRHDLIEAPWADAARFSGRLVHVLAGSTLAVRAEWHGLPDAIEALSDLDILRVNHGVAVNMNLVDDVELQSKTPRLGFHLYHEHGARRTEIFVRISRQAAREIRRRY